MNVIRDRAGEVRLDRVKPTASRVKVKGEFIMFILLIF